MTNGPLRDLLREIGTKAPVPIGALLLVYFIVQMFLGHLSESLIMQTDIATRARVSLDTNTAAMQALIARIETEQLKREDEHEMLLRAIQEKQR